MDRYHVSTIQLYSFIKLLNFNHKPNSLMNQFASTDFCNSFSTSDIAGRSPGLTDQRSRKISIKSPDLGIRECVGTQGTTEITAVVGQRVGVTL